MTGLAHACFTMVHCRGGVGEHHEDTRRKHVLNKYAIACGRSPPTLPIFLVVCRE